MSQPTFNDLEKRLHELQEQLNTDKISPEEFTRDVKELHLSFNGKEWRLGVAGQWVKLSSEKWIPDTPPLVETPPTIRENEQESTPVIPDPPHSNKPIIPSTPPGDTKIVKVLPVVVVGGIFSLLIMASVFWLAKTVLFPIPKQTAGKSAQSFKKEEENKPLAESLTFTSTAFIQKATTTVPATPIPTPSPTFTSIPLPTNTPSATSTPSPSPALSTPHPTATNILSPSPTPVSPTPVSVIPTLPSTSPFTPTGLIAYPAFNAATETYNLYIYCFETSEIIRTIENASQPDLSADGLQIVYRSWRLDRQGLFVEKSDGSGTSWQPSALFEATRPLWNSTGDIIFAANNLSPEQWTVYFSGDRPGFGHGRTPAWFRDGRVIYQGGIGTQFGLILVNPADGQTTFLTQTTQDTTPAPSPDGSMVAFISNREDTWDLYLLEVATQQVQRLTRDADLDTSPVWSPDGSHIAFVSNREGSWNIWTIQPDGANLQRLLNLPGSFDGKIKNIPDAQQTNWQTEHISWVKRR